MAPLRFGRIAEAAAVHKMLAEAFVHTRSKGTRLLSVLG
jgi:hypothetical protein